MANCLMKSGKCDEGKKKLREVLAARDTNRTRSDKDLDSDAESTANHTCPSSTGKTPREIVLRAANEMSTAYRAKDSDTCLARFETIAGNIDALLQAYKQSHDTDAQTAETKGRDAMYSGAICIAWAKGCSVGLTHFKRWYKATLRNMAGVDKIAEDGWATRIKNGTVTCTP
jgi:hypothetical protein